MLSRSAAFCAPAVGTVWDEIVARFANGQPRAAPAVHMRLRLSGVRRGGGMLSVAKLTLGQEAYYEQQVARGLDDYYAGRGESPGIWAGSGSAGSGWSASSATAIWARCCGASTRRARSGCARRCGSGRSPCASSTSRRASGARSRSGSRRSPATTSSSRARRASACCTRSTDDERVRREISEAHEASWQAALAYLEREACVVRRGHGGAIREHGEGFVAAAFRHRTSRAQDPHLHTHVVVANMTRTADGEWRALDGEAILKTYRLAAGYLYEAQLRSELSRRLGLEWTEPVKGMGELVGVPEEAIRAFSTRRQSLRRAHGSARHRGLRRRARGGAGDAGGEGAGRPAAAARGLEGARGRARPRPPRARRARPRAVARSAIASSSSELAAALLGRDGLTAKQTTFTMPELVQAVAGSLPAGADASTRCSRSRTSCRASPASSWSKRRRRPGGRRGSRPASCSQVEREAVELALAGRDVAVPAPERRPLAEALMQSGPT